MGKSLDEGHLVITEGQYEALKDGHLFIYEDGNYLTLINYRRYEELKKVSFFNYLSNSIEEDVNYLSELKEELIRFQGKNIDLYNYLDRYIPDYELDDDFNVMGLQEWLDYQQNEGDYYVERKISEEQLGDTKFYLLTYVRLWY